MRLIQKTRVFSVKCWDCGVAKHMHRTKAGAAACVEKQKKPPGRKIRWDDVAMSKLMQERRAGELLISLARRHNLSPARIAQVIHRAESREARRKQHETK